jgi:hypothetical protein
MKVISPYSYRLLLQNRQLGPFDRKTIAGMRMKKLVPKETKVLRSDGLMMTVAQLLVDRLEQRDLFTGLVPVAPGLVSALWPTFTVDFGGGWLRAGAFGLVGKGELRCQDDVLRVSGQRKSLLRGSRLARFKIALTDISQFASAPADPCCLVLALRADSAWAKHGKLRTVALRLADAGSVSEVHELLSAGQR